METIPIYIITLLPKPDRQFHVNQLIDSFSNINTKFTIFAAIDGRQLTSQHLKHYATQRYLNSTLNPTLQRPFLKGQIGCLLSHLQLWEYTLNYKPNLPYCVILEDDVYPTTHQLGDRLAELIDLLPNDFDHCYLYKHTQLQKNTTSNTSSNTTSNTSSNTNSFSFPPLTITPNPDSWGTVGYLVSRSGMIKLLKLFKPAFNTIDEMFRSVIKQRKIKSFMVHPNLVETLGAINSTDTTNSTMGSNVWNSGYFVNQPHS